MKKGYTVLTTVGHPWLTREIKSLKIPAVDERAQLHHVLKHFGVEVLPHDINTRCPVSFYFISLKKKFCSC